MRYLSAVLFLLALLSPSASFSLDTYTAKAEGVASPSADKADVKKKAIDAALKNAVLQATDFVLKKESYKAGIDAVEPLVSENPLSYVVNYRITAEGWVNHLDAQGQALDAAGQAPARNEKYHIWVEAAVDTAALRAVIGRAGSRVDEQSTDVTVNLVDITDWRKYRNVIDSLKRVAIIKDIAYNSFYRGRIVLVAKSAGSTQALMERIAKEVEGSFIVAPGGQRTITIKPAQRPAI